jgi:hypothetical protein
MLDCRDRGSQRLLAVCFSNSSDWLFVWCLALDLKVGRIVSHPTCFLESSKILRFSVCSLGCSKMSDKPAGESITPAVGGEEKENVKPTAEQLVPPASDPQVEAQPFDPTIGDTPKREVKSEENTSNGPTWIESAADSPLSQFCTALASIRETADYHEVYGLDISDSNSFHSKLILQKFLRANANDLEKAKGQLLETLRWRKQFQPLEQLKAAHDKARFGGFGYVTEIESVPGSVREGGKEIVTYNLYGAVKDKAKTFGDVEM